MRVLSFRNVYKRFKRIEALRGASFEIPRGSIAGLLGPNGAGKTTSIKISLGLLRRDRGEVEVLGFDPWHDEIEVRSRVGVLHERPIYPPNVRVSKLLLHLARLKGGDQRDVKRVVNVTGLKEYLDTKIKVLSRGYLQRLGLAQTLLGDPEVLLLDEPTANLDPIARNEILDLIKSLKEELDVTVLISTHILPELQRICDYAIFISMGTVLDYGSMEDLVSRHNVRAVLKITTTKPRVLASNLVLDERVESIEMYKSSLLVRTLPGYWRELENKAYELGAERVELVKVSLYELYQTVLKYAQ